MNVYFFLTIAFDLPLALFNCFSLNGRMHILFLTLMHLTGIIKAQV